MTKQTDHRGQGLLQDCLFSPVKAPEGIGMAGAVTVTVRLGSNCSLLAMVSDLAQLPLCPRKFPMEFHRSNLRHQGSACLLIQCEAKAEV